MTETNDGKPTELDGWETIYSGVVQRFVHSDGLGWQAPSFGVVAQSVLLAAATDQRIDAPVVASLIALGSILVGASAVFMLIDHKRAANTDQIILAEIEAHLLGRQVRHREFFGDEGGVTPFVPWSERMYVLRSDGDHKKRLSLWGGVLKPGSPHAWAATLITLLALGGVGIFIDAAIRADGCVEVLLWIGLAITIIGILYRLERESRRE